MTEGLVTFSIYKEKALGLVAGAIDRVSVWAEMVVLVVLVALSTTALYGAIASWSVFGAVTHHRTSRTLFACDRAVSA